MNSHRDVDDNSAESETLTRTKRPGVGRILLGLFVIYVGAVIMLMPWVVYILGGGSWESYVEQARMAFVIFPVASLLVIYIPGGADDHQTHRAAAFPSKAG